MLLAPVKDRQESRGARYSISILVENLSLASINKQRRRIEGNHCRHRFIHLLRLTDEIPV